jgi:O-antigen ligase
MENKDTKISLFYFSACISFIVGLVLQDFFKIPLTGGIIVLGLTWIFTLKFKAKFKTLLAKPIALALIALYVLHLISLLYSTNTPVALNDLRLKITLFLLPLFMLSTSLFSYAWKKKLLYLYFILMVGMAIFDLYFSYTAYLISENLSVFYYKNLPHLLFAKPHYAAWYYSFALFIGFYEITRQTNYKIGWILGAIVLLISLLLLSSRAYLFAFIIVAVISGISSVRSNTISTKSILRLLIPFGFVLSLGLLIPNTRARLTDTVAEVNKLFDQKEQRQTNPRVYIWQYAGKLILADPILGLGIGDAKIELNKALQDCDALFWNGTENVLLNKKVLNFHNQFLQTWAEVGVLGFLLLVFLLIKPFFLKNKHPLFLIFVGLTFFGFLTESMLERQAGVVFLAFMYPLLYSLEEGKKDA